MFCNAGAGDIREHAGGEIVDGRAEAAVDNAAHRRWRRAPHLAHQCRAVIAQRDSAQRRETQMAEFAGDQRRVRIDGITAHQLIAGQQQLYPRFIAAHRCHS
jgi:hypothetical protein